MAVSDAPAVRAEGTANAMAARRDPDPDASEGSGSRAYLAAESALLDWIRTGLLMITGGFVIARFPLFLRELAAARRGARFSFPGFSLWMGTVLVILGVLVTILAAAYHIRFVRTLPPGETLARDRSHFAVGVALALAAFGIAMTAYLFLLWTPTRVGLA